ELRVADVRKRRAWMHRGVARLAEPVKHGTHREGRRVDDRDDSGRNVGDDHSTLRGPGAVRIRFTTRPEERSTTATWDSRSAVTSATGSPPLAAARTRLGSTAAARA